MIQVRPLEQQWVITNKQESQQKRISDANHWAYTNLLKQNWISEATQWSYTNLLKKKTMKKYGSQLPACGTQVNPTHDHRKANANLWDLQLYPLTNKESKTGMSDANLWDLL